MNDQEKWHELERTLGESGAKAHVAAKLRELANTVEADGYPDVLGWSEEEFGEILPMASFTLTLSYPWPG